MSAPARRIHLTDDEVSNVRALGAVGTAKRLVEYVDTLAGRHASDERDRVVAEVERRVRALAPAGDEVTHEVVRQVVLTIISDIAERGLPKWADLFGIAPNFTGGMDIDEYLEESRGEA